VHLVVGPTSSQSARAWVAYGRRIVTEAATSGSDLGEGVDRDVLTAFARYLDEWEQVAGRADEFKWETELDVDVAEYHVLGFFRLARRMTDRFEATGRRTMPAEAGPFYRALVGAVLEALRHEGAAPAEFSDQLAGLWPGVADPPDAS
jgi:hypothetical protein